ncbi:MAG: hypothetical protein DSO07_04985 [Thermoproteota archaeon]|jgi:HSP20 family protein|uniref:Hsp20/alpha crystallin family protein n=1 Tax=Candidatus Methanodesulfokora washburnensis TaxID=2478471 RepID=A0A429GHJ6_9CREN|nr:Hsp20/alpha crystallin family protein [Candidatus Methanodesulfokores washburnensis]RSN73255.1 Hsp20/alpha crystallin family protein [Candidatus Methanodesulfokores washburnensis]RZN61614.1 MAG: Hsp20/alpha crystallin family protein [Candidatus Methanodesulfokores washburnensis]TDA41371.1 MAG: hypothetical protein DSO07_04985 [Candidatus Korarchaeota archaeon]
MKYYFPEHEEVVEPLADLKVMMDTIKLSMDIPGVEKKNLELKVSEKTVIVRAFAIIGKRNVHYYRRIDLPVEIDPDTVKAKLTAGVLEITAKIKPKGFREVAVE